MWSCDQSFMTIAFLGIVLKIYSNRDNSLTLKVRKFEGHIATFRESGGGGGGVILPILNRVELSIHYLICDDMINRAGSLSSNKCGFVNC